MRSIKAKDKEEIFNAIKSIREDLNFLEEHIFKADAIELKDKCDYITHYMNTLYHWVDKFEQMED